MLSKKDIEDDLKTLLRLNNNPTSTLDLIDNQIPIMKTISNIQSTHSPISPATQAVFHVQNYQLMPS